MQIKRMALSVVISLVALLAISGPVAAGEPFEPADEPGTLDVHHLLTTPLRTMMDRTFVESPNYHIGVEAPPGYEEKVAELKQLYGDDVLEPGTSGSWPDDVAIRPSAGMALSNDECWPCIERQAFAWDTSMPDVETVLGLLYPYNASNEDDVDFTIYFEREIDLEPSYDFVEFIIEPYENGTQTHLWIAFFDEGQWLLSNPPSCPVQNIDVVQTSETVYEYYLHIGEDGVYDIGIKNTANDVWQWIECDDSDDPGEYVGVYHASSEIYATDFSQDFYAWARIRDDWTWVDDGDARRPRETYDPSTYTSAPHVYVGYTYDSSDRSKTTHSAFD